ncbi:GDSL-type esterase/lipase family protein [Carboxylicivirga sp. N1E11]
MKALLVLTFMCVTLPLKAQKTRVACVGNSVTFGAGIDDREHNSYPARLQKLLGEEYEVGNFGKSGATLLTKGHRPYVEQAEYEAALNFKPDILIVSLGLNDTDPRNWPLHRDEFIEDYMALINSFKSRTGEVPKVYIGNMTPIFHTHWRFESGTRDWFWQIQESIKQVAANCNATLIDWHSPLYQRPDLFPDALHPVVEGAAIMAQCAAQYLSNDFGGLQLASVFAHKMVLQRHQAIPLWGKGTPGAIVSARLNGQQANTVVDQHGRWQLTLPAMHHGGPYTLKVKSGDEELRCREVMIGEVWLCAGQSNMDFQVQQSLNGSKALTGKLPRNIRLLHYKVLAPTDSKAWDDTTLARVNKLEYLDARWQEADKETVGAFSAIGWYFGQGIEAALDVPVGLIQVAVGGAPTEAFIDRKTLEFDPVLLNMLYNWPKNDHIMGWVRQRAGENTQGATQAMQRHPYHPAYIYEAAVDEIAGFPLKGVLWYQGESNSHNVELHEQLFPALVNSWRKLWQQADLPFYMVQLSSIERPGWQYFRDSQRRMAASLEGVEMVVSSDVGERKDVHPKNKKVIADRLVQLALYEAYGQRETARGSIAIASVEQQDDQLKIKVSHSHKLSTSDGGVIRELEVAGADALFRKAKAQLKGNTILIETGYPVKAVRYGWHPYTEGNIVNEGGIPLSTFCIKYPYNISNKSDNDHE